jgi:AcrR family transcriptional regulator
MRPPKQERSRRTLERILAAARSLLSEHEARDVSLREIADTAEVSLSSLFARFKSKDALLDHLHEELCEARLRDADEVVTRLELADASADETVRIALRALVRSALARGGMERALIGAAAQVESISRREQRFQKRRLALLHAFVVRRLGAGDRAVSDGEVESLIRLVLAAAPELIRTAEPDEPEVDELVERWAELVLRALGLSDDAVARQEVVAGLLPAAYDPPVAGDERAVFDRILDGAEQVFDGRGLAGIPSDEFAKACGLPEETIWKHFGDSRALLHASVDRLLREAMARAETLAVWGRWRERDFEALTRETILEYLKGWKRWGGLIRTVRLEERHDAVLLERHAEIDRGVGNIVRRVALRLEPSLAARGLGDEAFSRTMATIAAALRTAVDRPAIFDLASDAAPEELTDELTELAMRYLGVSPRREREER